MTGPILLYFRWTTADGYLKPALKVRKNLKVALNMQVRRVLFDKDSKTATGVEVTKDSGRTVFHVSKTDLTKLKINKTLEIP